MRKRGLISFWLIAALAWFSPANVYATNENLLVNGSFTANMGGWTGANGGASCSGGSPSLGLWGGPQLTFSYVQNSVTQQVSVPSPSNLELSFLASSEWGGTYSATLADSNESATTGVLTAGANQVSTLEINTTEANELVTVTFSGVDSLFWAGCYGPVIRNASLVAVAEPTSLVVTSLLDDGSVGTLRWAINQANSQSGGIYDSITLPAGTITLGSALPTITQNLTVVGDGQTSTIIDGAGQFRVFNVNPGISLTVSDMTLKRGQNTNGGLIYNNRGTVTANRVRFTSMTGGNAVFNNNGVSTAYYTDATWDGLFVGIAGDYGSTPNLASGVTSWGSTSDTVFQNRTYVTRGTFTGNTYGINNYRFTKIVDSSFTNNSGFAANVTGLNRTQIINSSFTNNGTAIYHSSWIPVGWNMGTDNRLITGNTFTNNTIAINLNDSWNNNQKNQSWATVQNNTWDGNGTWISYQQWDGSSNISYTATPLTEGTPFVQSSNIIPPPPTTTTTTTTTTIPPTTTTTTPPTCGPYQSVTVMGKASGAVWGSGPYTDDSDLGAAAVHAGLIEVGETATLEISDVSYYQAFTGSTANGVTTQNWNSGWCGFNIQVATPPTTTTIPTTITTTEPEPTTPPDTTIPEPEPTVPPDTIPETPDTTDGGPDGGTGSSTDTTSPETTVPQPAPEEETPDTTPDIPLEEETPEAVVDGILANDPSPEELADAVSNALAATESEEQLVDVAAELLTSDLEPEQFAAVIEEVFSQDLSDEALTELVDTVFAQDLSDEEIAAVVTQVFTADISDEAFAEVLEAVFKEPLSDEAFTSVIDAILDEPISDEAFDELVDVLGSDTVSDEQVVAAVDTIIDNGLSEEQSVSIATSGEVLESITGDQATEIFDTLPIDEISDAEAVALVEAVQDAPEEVKEAFEGEINIFAAGNVDTYIPIGSEVPVGTRRVIIAATAVVVAAAPAPAFRKGR